jgi:hypothetical protein
LKCVTICIHLPDSYRIQYDLKQGYVLSPLIFDFALDYKKVQANQARLKLNGTHELLAYAYDMNLLGDNIIAMKMNTET